jgi:hypothetical protein
MSNHSLTHGVDTGRATLGGAVTDKTAATLFIWPKSNSQMTSRKTWNSRTPTAATEGSGRLASGT